MEQADAAGDPRTKAKLLALQAEIEAGLEAAQRDKVLLDHLVDIRSAKADDEDGSITDAAYADAFGEAGFDVEGPDPKQAGARIAARPEPVRPRRWRLDHWTGVAQGRGSKGAAWPNIVATRRRPRPGPRCPPRGPGRRGGGQATGAGRPAGAKADAGSWAPASLVLLAETLGDAGDAGAGVRVLRRASGVYPTDVWVHYTLGGLLRNANPPRRTKQSRPTPRPGPAARAGPRAGPPAGESRAGRRSGGGLPRPRGPGPGGKRHLTCLQVHLDKGGRAAEAKAIQERTTAEATATFERAIAAGREAIRLKPDDAMAHFRLGRILGDQGKPGEAEAIAAYREAIRLKPDLDEAYHNLSNALEKQGKLDEAIAVLRNLSRLRPGKPNDLIDLSKLLGTKGWPRSRRGDRSRHGRGPRGGPAESSRRLGPRRPRDRAAGRNFGKEIDEEAIAELLTVKRFEPNHGVSWPFTFERDFVRTSGIPSNRWIARSQYPSTFGPTIWNLRTRERPSGCFADAARGLPQDQGTGRDGVLELTVDLARYWTEPAARRGRAHVPRCSSQCESNWARDPLTLDMVHQRAHALDASNKPSLSSARCSRVTAR